VDFEAAEIRFLRAVAFDQLLAQEGGEVGGARFQRRRLDVGRGGQRLVDAFDVLFVRDVALFEHLFEHQVAPPERVFRVDLGVEGRGRGDDPGQRRRLPGLEHRGAGLPFDPAAGVGGAEVGLGGGLDPVGALAEVDRVQVLGQDLRLRPVLVEFVGERRLAELLQDRAAALRFERVLDELLGDRRGALLGRAAAEVTDQGAGDAAQVDAVVFVEAGVLDRDHRILDVGGDLRGVEEDFVLVGAERADHPAAGVDHLAVLLRLVLSEVVDRGQILGDRRHHPEDHRDHREDPEPEQDEEKPQFFQARFISWGLAGRSGGEGGSRGSRRVLAAVAAASTLE
jgi:hypothetical protein